MNSLKSNSSLIRFVLFSLAVCQFTLSSAKAGSVRIIPEDTVGGTALWNLQPACGGGNCYISYLTDGVDNNYIWSLSSLQHHVTMTNTSGIPGTATIDSFVTWFRCAVDNTANNDRIRPRIRSMGTGNYCDGAFINIETTTFADSSKKFTSWPTAANTCTAGGLSIARMDSMEIAILDVGGDSLKVTQCSVVVWYSETGGAIKSRRRHLLIGDGGFEEFAKFCSLDPNWITGFKDNWLWREE